MHRIRNTLLLAAAIAGCSSPVPPTAPDAMAPEPEAVIPMGDGISGRFVRTGYATSGSVTLTRANGIGRLVFSDDFQTTQLPGPVVYLNTRTNPNVGMPLRIGALKSISGRQEYVFSLPPGVTYLYVLLWCDPFNVPIAEARLPVTP